MLKPIFKKVNIFSKFFARISIDELGRNEEALKITLIWYGKKWRGHQRLYESYRYKSTKAVAYFNIGWYY